jgi:transglutaminase-like putative cysteine protease
MLKDLVVNYTNSSGSASITMPRNDDQQTLVNILGDEGGGWSIRTHENGVDKYLYNANAPSSGTIQFRMDVVSYTLASTKATPGDAHPGSSYRGSDSYIDLNDSTMEAVARQIRSDNNLDGNLTKLNGYEKWAIAQDAYDWAIGNLDFTSMSSNEGSAYAFDYLRGDCTEFAASAVALLRENSIHARVITSWWAGTDGVQGQTSFPTHHRFEVFLPDMDRDGVAGEGHWFLMDNNLGEFPQYGYGFGYGADDSINLGVSSDGTWTYSGLSGANYSIVDV